MSGSPLAMAIGCLSVMLLAACRTSGTMQGGPATVPTERIRAGEPIPPLLDTLAHRLLNVDLERARLSVRYTPAHSELVALKQQREALCEALRRLPADPTADARITARLLHATEERLAGLTVERLVLLSRLTPQHDDVRSLDVLVGAVEAKREALRSPGASRNLRTCS